MLFVLLAFGVPALAAGLGLIAIVRRPGSRLFRWAGIALIAVAAAQAGLVVGWLSAACWETWQPCEGSAIDVAPIAGFLTAFLGSVAMAIALALTWGWYGPGGTPQDPRLKVR